MNLTNINQHPAFVVQQKRHVMKDVGFFMTAEIMLLGPTLLLCVVMGQVWPLFLMMICQILGVLLGIINFTAVADVRASAVPLQRDPDVSSNSQKIDWKEAA